MERRSPQNLKRLKYSTFSDTLGIIALEPFEVMDDGRSESESQG